MSQTKTLKVRVALLCILVGIVLALVAVVTDHWAVLSPHVEHHNSTCEAAHFGLWRICTKRIFVGDKERSCGPITLPGGNVPPRPPLWDDGAPETGASLGGGGGPPRRCWRGGAGLRSAGARLPLFRALGLAAGQGAGVWMGGQTAAQQRARGSADSLDARPPPNAGLRWKGRLGGVHSRLACGHTPLKGNPSPCKRGMQDSSS